VTTEAASAAVATATTVSTTTAVAASAAISTTAAEAATTTVAASAAISTAAAEAATTTAVAATTTLAATAAALATATAAAATAGASPRTGSGAKVCRKVGRNMVVARGNFSSHSLIASRCAEGDQGAKKSIFGHRLTAIGRRNFLKSSSETGDFDFHMCSLRKIL
jgi:membrane protein involved in colicin uptake